MKRLSPSAQARSARISQRLCSDLERGDSTKRSLDFFARVERALGVSADYLLGMEKRLEGGSQQGHGAIRRC